MLNFIPASQSACVRINHPPWLSPIIEDFYVRDLAPRRVFIVIADLLTRMRAGYMIHTTRSILVWSGLSLRPPGNDWVSVASARAFYYVFMCSEWALESWPGPRAPTRGPGTRESSENLESTEEATEQFRNVLYDKADFRELNYSAHFAEINQIGKKKFIPDPVSNPVVPGGEKYAARSVMISWLCHELLWSSRDSQHPTPVPVTRLCCRPEKKWYRNLRQYFPLFASCKFAWQQSDPIFVSEQPSGDDQSECQERDKSNHPGQDESRSRWRGLDALSVWWWRILADWNHGQIFWHRSKWRVMIRKSLSCK